MMNTGQLTKFCDEWLEAWTGNSPDKLIGFYSSDAIYSDPSVHERLEGHGHILPHFRKLLARNPTWVWTREELFVTEKGFTLKWKARIPVGDAEIVEYGLDIVEIADSKIARNEVYFDRTQLLKSLQALK
jgi:hypothetical protein